MRMLEIDPSKRPTAEEVKECITELKPNTNYNISTLSQQGEIWIYEWCTHIYKSHWTELNWRDSETSGTAFINMSP